MAIIFQDLFDIGISPSWIPLFSNSAIDSIAHNSTEGAAQFVIAPGTGVAKAFLENSALQPSANVVIGDILARISQLPQIGTDIILLAFGSLVHNSPIVCGLLYSTAGGGTIYWRVQLKDTAGVVVGDFRAVAGTPATFDLTKTYHLTLKVVEAPLGELHLSVDDIEVIAETNIKTDYGKELTPIAYPAVDTFNVGACFIGERSTGLVVDVFEATVSDEVPPAPTISEVTLTANVNRIRENQILQLQGYVQGTDGYPYPNALVSLYDDYGQVGSPQTSNAQGTVTWNWAATNLGLHNFYAVADATPSNTFQVTVTTEAPSCFIATAAYGSPTMPQLQSLRNFRDRCLPNRLTQAYYAVSPPLADAIRHHYRVRQLIRGYIDFAIKCFKHGGWKNGRLVWNRRGL